MKKAFPLMCFAFLTVALLAPDVATAAVPGAADLVPILTATLAMDGPAGAGVGAGLAAGLGVVGAGLGIGRIGGSSVEAIARQPEMAGRIFINMILTAALVEGVALFAVIVGVIGLGKIPAP